MKKNLISKFKNSNMHSSILQFFLKKGKLKTAEKSLENLIKFIFRKVGMGEYYVFTTLYKTLYTDVEVRSIKYRRNLYLVPFPINRKRRFFLITKFLFDAALKEKTRLPIALKLSEEIIKYFEKNYENSESFMKKNSIEKTALEYRSNCHFRWY